MPLFLDTSEPDFEARFRTFLGTKRETDADVDTAVAAIIADVAARGDAAVIEMTERWDRLTLTPATLAFSPAEIDAAVAAVPAAERAALELAATRIRTYHERQLPGRCPVDRRERRAARLALDPGRCGRALRSGRPRLLSVLGPDERDPGAGRGVERLVICAPTPEGKSNPLVLLAARLAGVETVYRIGGAQAIAALAFGTETIAPVDTITGPGNAWVAAAKRRVFGRVGIDMIAGPSEVLIIADRDNDPDWIALDLLSQAEHDAAAQAILVTDDAGFGREVAAAVERRLATLDRRAIAGASWRDFGAVITVSDWDEAVRLSDRIAPEHLELMTQDAEGLAARIRHAGAIFIGAWTPEAIGDYVGGPNHVLPTARSARFSSGLSVLDFMKRTTIARMTPAALAQIGPAAEILARSESLQAHGLSVRARLDRLNRQEGAA
jgi:histidinol dehydrogenase